MSFFDKDTIYSPKNENSFGGHNKRWHHVMLNFQIIFLLFLFFSTTVLLIQPVFGLDFPDVESCFEGKQSTPEKEWSIGLCYEVSSRELYRNPSTSAFLEHITATRAEFVQFRFSNDILISDFHRFSKLVNLDFIDGKAVKLEELKKLYFQLAWFTGNEQFLKPYRNLISNPISEEEKRNLEYLAFLFRDFPNKDVFPFKHLNFKKAQGEFSKLLKKGRAVSFEVVDNEIKFNKLDFSPTKTQALVLVSIDCGFSTALLEIIANDKVLRNWFSRNSTILVVQDLDPSVEDYYKWNQLNPDLKYQYVLRESFIPVPLNFSSGVPKVYFIKGNNILFNTNLKDADESTVKELLKGITSVESQP
jgi:hypothetical protein